MVPGRDEYRRLLSTYQGRGYQFHGFHDHKPAGSIVLRHDIDFSVELAAEMAQVEAEMDVRSTYFFMLTSNFYNPFSKASRAAIERVRDLGHAVSIHFDPTVHADVDEGLRQEKAAFEAAFGPVEVVSIHRPGPFLDDNNRRLPGVSHTYEDRFFRDLDYISDSGGAFRHQHPLDGEAATLGRTIHLLIHPVWWTTEGESPTQQLLHWRAAHLNFLADEMAFNCKTFDRDALPRAGAA